ncbi:hypothetical protein Pmani_023579 [Petrolisthes manimaculis]|uniref:DDE Tnp4 domain-containing protein n=1 Tax=Petrolisthes manimaculis TaxID=1843537 RepID=A0AAE1PAS9_9EUCA|nr:hypothetical protein Pmani_023579 [Petrolisthes manimaculis]
MSFKSVHASFLALLLAEEEDDLDNALCQLKLHKNNKKESFRPAKRERPLHADSLQCYDGNEMVIKTEESVLKRRRKYGRSAKDFLQKGGMMAFYNLIDFHTHFGMTRSQVEELITELQPYYHYERGSKLPLENVILASLWVLASQESYRAIAERFKTSKSVVCTSLHNFCSLVSRNLENHITWPSGVTMRSTVKGFMDAGFPGTVGVMGAYRVAIGKPKDVDEPDAYMNDKTIYCTTLLAVCDDKHRFTYVNIGHPGTLDDADVFRRCELYEAFKNDPLSLLPLEFNQEGTMYNYHILGDTGFPLSEHVMTPYEDRGCLTPKQTEYNRRHLAAMIVISRSVGMLKGRFNRLKLLHMQHLGQCSVAIKACCILHNLCIETAEPDMFEFDDDDMSLPSQTLANLQENQEGAEKRDAIADSFL